MYEGNEPSRKGAELVSGGYADVWSCMYGGGLFDGEEIIYASFSQNQNVNIYIFGDCLWITKFMFSGKYAILEYSNKQSVKMPTGVCFAKSRISKLEHESIEQILSKRYDCRFWQLVQRRARELYTKS